MLTYATGIAETCSDGEVSKQWVRQSACSVCDSANNGDATQACALSLAKGGALFEKCGSHVIWMGWRQQNTTILHNSRCNQICFLTMPHSAHAIRPSGGSCQLPCCERRSRCRPTQCLTVQQSVHARKASGESGQWQGCERRSSVRCRLM